MLTTVKNHINYAIDENGNFHNMKTKRQLKQTPGNHGYLTVYVDGKNRLVHRLVAETFIENPLNKPCVNHIDGNKQNNSIDNLEFVSYTGNLLHARKTGLNPYHVLYGEQSRHHTLTQNDVDYIRQVYKKYDKQFGGRALAKRFNVTESCISSIVRGVSWVGGDCHFGVL